MNIKKILKISGIVIIVLIVLFYGLKFYTKLASPQETIELKEKDLAIKVIYSQPSAKDRKIFGGLVPYGKVWRTGANEATEITFNQDVKFGGQNIKAGTYTLFSIPNPEKWTIILNSVLGQWGSFSYNAEKDVLKVEITPEKNDKIVQKFKISLDKKTNQIELSMVWDKTKVVVPIEYDKINAQL